MDDTSELSNGLSVGNGNLIIDYKTNKPKIKMKVYADNNRISDTFTDGMVKQYNLAKRGYLFSFKTGRKQQNLFVIIAPEDETVKIHCVQKRKLVIDVEQSEYASKVVKRLCHDSIYLRFLRFNDKWTTRFLIVDLILTVIPLGVFLLLRIIIFVMRMGMR